MTWKILLLAGMIPVALCTASLAQPPAGPPPGMGRPHPPMAPPSPEMLARRADDMALLIGLRADQRPALDALLQPPAPPPPRPEAGGDESFLHHLDREERRAAEHAEREKQHLATLRAFYAKLDAQQKPRFVALMRLSHGPDGMGPPPPPPGSPGEGMPPR